MACALAAHGKSVELVQFDGEDHWLSGAATRTETLRRSITLVDRHTVAAAAAEAAEQGAPASLSCIHDLHRIALR